MAEVPLITRRSERESAVLGETQMTADALVLLVEDEVLIRMMLEEELADAGFGLVVAKISGSV